MSSPFRVLVRRSAVRLLLFLPGSATTGISTLSLHDALPIFCPRRLPCTGAMRRGRSAGTFCRRLARRRRSEPSRSEEHTSELQSRVDLVCRLLLEKEKKEQAPIPDQSEPSHQRATGDNKGTR